eukprot:370734-Pelagomonas_calceolata.AAC.3
MSPQAKAQEKLAPRFLLRPAAPPWRPAWQPAASRLMLTTPGINRTNSGHEGGLPGPGQTSLLLRTCSRYENPASTRGPRNNPK